MTTASATSDNVERVLALIRRMTLVEIQMLWMQVEIEILGMPANLVGGIDDTNRTQ